MANFKGYPAIPPPDYDAAIDDASAPTLLDLVAGTFDIKQHRMYPDSKLDAEVTNITTATDDVPENVGVTKEKENEEDATTTTTTNSRMGNVQI